MLRLLAIFSVVASMLSLPVLANPTFPGTCLVKGMAAPHGVTPATDANYTVVVKQTAKAATGNTYSVTIDGDGTFTGILLYATDTASKARFGSFTKIPTGYAPLTTCKGENPKTNTLGHSTPEDRNLPVTFTWTDAGHNGGKAWAGSFTGVLMSSPLTTWYVIPPTAVTGGTGGGGNSTSSAASSGASSVPASQTTPSDPSGTSNANSTGNATSTGNSSSASSTGAPVSSATRPDISFVLCILISAFALFVRL